MADGKIEKMEKDWSSVVDTQLPETEKLAKSGKLGEAIEQLMVLEKQTRTSADLASNSRVLLHIISLAYNAKDWKQLNESITVLSKKRALLKQAVTKMVQEAIKYVDEIKDTKIKLELIDTLRTVTEGKIFVEVERAHLTRTLAKIKENEGKIVETYGSMEKREKTDFILEQMRLCLAKKDYIRASVISRKISIKFFEDPANHDLKLRFYELMIQHSVHMDKHLDTCKHYRQLYDTPVIRADEKKWQEVLKHVVLFIVLSPYDNEQSDLIHRINEDPNLSKLVLFKEFLKCFITNELMRWPKIEEIYGTALKASSVFDAATDGGLKRYKTLHKRVIEHNIRVIAKYYNRITLKRLTQLLDLTMAEAEEFLSNLVVEKTIYAKIDRPAGIVSFVPRKDPNAILNEWSHNINDLLDLIVKTGHLITKEEMVHSIKQTI
ncbi:proteasome regulatory particle subunit [Polyrhizophydium stewartii]|uniref:Proteasome regulatory particle subunit n=1 Tax=Polyrhizophydium stewartii TaxID=2732419 RepID=A0ABR4MXI7_9FUNG